MKRCTVCGSKLGGTSHGTGTRSQPTRRFGGVLCHSCVERVIELKSRLDDGTLKPGQVDLAYKSYVDQTVISVKPRPARQKPAKKKEPKKPDKKEKEHKKRTERVKKRRAKK